MSPISKYGVISEFPVEERDAIWQELVAKSGGVCQLCEDPIDVNSDNIIIEHKDNRGATEISNLYIAHRACNSLKKDLPYAEAKRMIKFKKFCESRGHNISFDDILNKYAGSNSRKPIRMMLDNNRVTLVLSDEDRVETNVWIDPATDTKYCFADIPLEYIHNDEQVQPRRISWEQAWTMVVDFAKHPIHEPSSCRINLDNNQVGRLLQFDGQHKTTAQILLGRKTIQTKIYINPDVTMIKDLIIVIQNRIKKIPLAPAIHLEKMSSVYLEKFEASGATSEKDFVEIYLLRERANAKKEVFSSIHKNILDNSNNRFKKYIQPEGTRGGKFPLSMNLTLNHILKFLVCQDLQTVQIGSPQDFRVDECENVVFILNILADELLEEGKWPLNAQPQESSTDYMKAKRFFRSGAVRFWNNDVLRRAIIHRQNLIEKADQSRLLLRPLTDDQRELIRGVVVRLANHPIWTDNDGTIDSKLNENSVETSQTLFTAGSPDGYKIPLTASYLLNF